jgi:hypothetical protein
VATGIALGPNGAQIDGLSTFTGPLTISDSTGGLRGSLYVDGQDGVHVVHQLAVDELLKANGGIDAYGHITALSGGISTAVGYDFTSGGQFFARIDDTHSKLIADKNGCYYA